MAHKVKEAFPETVARFEQAAAVDLGGVQLVSMHDVAEVTGDAAGVFDPRQNAVAFNGRPSEETLVHELTHAAQFQKHGGMRALSKASAADPFYESPAEREARAVESAWSRIRPGEAIEIKAAIPVETTLWKRKEYTRETATGRWARWAAFVLQRIASGIPGLGTLVDVISAICNFASGNYLGGVLDLLSAIPGVGDVLATPLQFALKFGDRLPPGMLAQGRRVMDQMIAKIDEGLNEVLTWNIPEWCRREVAEIRAAFRSDVMTRRAALREFPPMNIRRLQNHPEYPSRSAWKPEGGGRRAEVVIKDNNIRDYLNDHERGDWVKIYHDGIDAGGRPVSLHYFFNKRSGAAADLKVKPGWSN